MKTVTTFLFLVGFLVCNLALTQNLPQVELKTVDGTPIMFTDILGSESATVLLFWDPESNESCNNLETVQDAWSENLQKQGVRMVAVCTDCHGSWNHVKPMANGKNWDFDIYIDTNNELKRGMGISNISSSMLYDKNNNLVCRQLGFYDGDEEMICRQITQNLDASACSADVK